MGNMGRIINSLKTMGVKKKELASLLEKTAAYKEENYKDASIPLSFLVKATLASEDLKEDAFEHAADAGYEIDDAVAMKLTADFEAAFDCNRAENDIWDEVIKNHFNPPAETSEN